MICEYPNCNQTATTTLDRKKVGDTVNLCESDKFLLGMLQDLFLDTLPKLGIVSK